MKKLLLIVALFLPSLAGAQVFRYQDLCKAGGQPALVQGLRSSNDLIGSYPGCTVDVFISGTGTHATIYSDAGMTPLGNPFTADIVYGTYGFYAAAGCYDVVTSGAGIPAPQTQSAICLATSVTSGTVTSVTDTNNASALFTLNITNQTTTPLLTFGLTQFGAHAFWGNGTGSTTTPSATVIGVGDLPFTYSGNTTKLVTGGTISGTSSPLCTDASGNATTVGCSSSNGYNTVQDEGTPLTQRSVINCVGAGITCSDDSGSMRTTFSVPLSGTGTTGTVPLWTASNTLGNSSLVDAFPGLSYGPSNSTSTETFTIYGVQSKILTAGHTLSGDGENLDLQASATLSNSVSASFIGITGGQNTITPSAGNIIIEGGDGLANPSTGATITLQPGNGVGSGLGGDINLEPSNTGVIRVAGALNLGVNSGTDVILKSASGAPSGSCTKTTLYIRVDAPTTSTAIYVCVAAAPAVWTPITVP